MTRQRLFLVVIMLLLLFSMCNSQTITSNVDIQCTIERFFIRSACVIAELQGTLIVIFTVQETITYTKNNLKAAIIEVVLVNSESTSFYIADPNNFFLKSSCITMVGFKGYLDNKYVMKVRELAQIVEEYCK